MKFSVIIPVYNVREFLSECLDSVVAAARRAPYQVECLCIDDGSTDGSSEILDAYAVRYGEIVAVHQANWGVAETRNRALQSADGDWFLFLDADDLIRKDVFEIIGLAAERYPDADMLGYGIHPFYSSTCAWESGTGDWHDSGISEQIGDELASMSFCQFAYRRSVHGDARFKRLTVGEDLVFSAQAFSRSRGCKMTNVKLYGYRFRSDSATHAEMSVAKLLDVPRFNIEAFSALDGSGKAIGSRFSQGRGNEWIENFPRELLRIRAKGDIQDVWKAWFDSLRVAAGMRCLSPWQRRVAAFVSHCRSTVCVRLLCCFPHWLAKHHLK